VRELGQREVRVVRLNSERAPTWELAVIPGERWSVNDNHRALDSAECAGVWWRRPELPPMPREVPAGQAEAVAGQWRTFMAALADVPGPKWVSPPGAIRAAEGKAAQLANARKIGFDVPETIWTNSLVRARAFIDHCGGSAVVKSVASAWWEEDEVGFFVFARAISIDDLPSQSRLGAAPVALQQPIIPKRDVRVSVIGHRALTAVREAVGGTAEPLDWRRAEPGDWVTHELPVHVASMCKRLVEQFGLRFGGIDLAVDDNGRHWFLELNPNGEWGWLQRASLPIAQALTDELLS